MKTYFEQHEKVFKDATLVILLVELAKQRGIHPDKLLKGTKLFQHDLIQADFAISQQQFVKLIGNTIKFINTPEIPFLLGSRLFPAQLGQTGLALCNARNLQDMLRIIKCSQSQIFPFMFLMEKHHQEKRYFIFNHAITCEGEGYHQFMCELLASMIISAVKWRTNCVLDIQIRFPYTQPEHIEQYQAYFEQAYRFTPHIGSFIVPTIVKNHCGLQLSLPENIMRKPFTESNQAIKRYHLNQVDRSGFSVGIIQYVYQTIGQYLAQNKEVTLEKIALGLSVSPATLKRKLANHHTSYQNLLDLFRQQQAIFQLTEQGYNNEKVASELHFSDLTNFRRSFKRWTGLTPNEIKQAL